MNQIRGVLLAGGFALLSLSTQAAGLQSAEVTRVYNQVELLVPNQSASAAKVGDDVSGHTAVQTGGQSRTELQFNDQTIARLGANSVFSFERGTRDLNLNEGVILLEVPKNAGGATINTAAVTAAVTGTTVMIECRKGKKAGQSLFKFIVLEGTMRLNLNGRHGESVLLNAGQIVSLHGNEARLPDPQYVDVEHLTKTSGLMSSQFPPLKNEPYIFQTVNDQRLLKTKGKLIGLDYNLHTKRKNPVLQVVSATSQASMRADAAGIRSNSNPPKAALRSNPSRVNNPPPKPPKPPVRKPPKPFKLPPRPKPPKPPKPALPHPFPSPPSDYDNS